MIMITKEQIKMLHTQLISQTGGRDGIRDEGLLESAAAAPFQSFGDAQAHPTICEKAAQLGFGLIRNHAFLDGNKRIGAHAMLVFLALNQMELNHTQKELSDMILSVAAGEKGAQDLFRWVLAHRI